MRYSKQEGTDLIKGKEEHILHMTSDSATGTHTGTQRGIDLVYKDK